MIIRGKMQIILQQTTKNNKKLFNMEQFQAKTTWLHRWSPGIRVFLSNSLRALEQMISLQFLALNSQNFNLYKQFLLVVDFFSQISNILQFMWNSNMCSQGKKSSNTAACRQPECLCRARGRSPLHFQEAAIFEKLPWEESVDWFSCIGWISACRGGAA